MKKIILILSTFIIFVADLSSQNTSNFPCIIGKVLSNVLIGKSDIKISTTKGNAVARFSADGIISNNPDQVTKTYIEDFPYWEANLEDNLTLESIKIYYPPNSYSEIGFKNYYILTSDTPFSDGDLHHQLENQSVSHIYVESPKTSGYLIPLNYKQAQYVRIQMAERGTLTLSEIILTGTGGLKEICGNASDDDCDGKTDCDDTDCGVVFNNIDPKMPSCPTCSDGKIGIQASGKNIKYSINGGQTFSDCGNNGAINNLPEGDHEIILMNTLTGCQTRKTVSLKAITAPVNQCCPNGGFENGKFDKWTGGSGGIGTAIPNNTITGNTSPPKSSNFDIIASGNNSVDSNVGDGIILNSPTGGPYIAKLGDNETGGNVAKMTFCMKVSECNKDFIFNFAVVLEDDGHSASEQPRLEWKIKDPSGNTLKNYDPIIADKDNPYFKVKETGGGAPLVYRPWTCEKLDLKDFMGKDICVEFSVSDCTLAQHKGYAYIDGLCKKEEAKPSVVLTGGNPIFCKGQKVTISGLESKNFNKYNWEVCRYINGVPNNCFSTPAGYDNKPIIDDALGFFFNPPHDPAKPLTCGDKFKVTLNLDNGCFIEKTTTEFTYICDETPKIDYPDIIVCTNNDVQIMGTTTNCSNCTYTWTPPQYLGNPSSPTPIIQGSLNSLAMKQTYYVTAKSSNGCITPPDEVRIFQSDELGGKVSFSFEDGDCEYTTFVNVEFDFPVDGSKIEADVSVLTNNGIIIVKGTLITFGIQKVHKFRIAQGQRRCKDATFKAYVKYKAPTTMFNQVGNCALIAEYKRLGNANNCTLNIYVPNIFSPNNDGINDTFFPNFSPNMVTFAKFSIFNRWGDLVFETEATAIGTGFLTGSELAWDGFFKGKISNFDSYVWMLDFNSCSDTKETCNGFNSIQKILKRKGDSLMCGNVQMVSN